VLPSSDQFPLQVGLNQLLSSTPAFHPVAGAGLNITSAELALAVIVSVLPVLVLVLFSPADSGARYARGLDERLTGNWQVVENPAESVDL
jgi:hypothetical protein